MEHGNIESFWKEFLAAPAGAGASSLPYEAEQFGDSPDLASELGALIFAGTKTATCSAVWDYESDNEPFPVVGDRIIVLDGQGEPLCIIETTEVEFRLYSEIDEQFAADEGEGDRTLRYWREAHWAFFSRFLPTIGRQPDEDMPLVCERFRVIFRQSGA